MESQILIRGSWSIKSSSSIYRVSAAVPCVRPAAPGDTAPWSVGVSLKSRMSSHVSDPSAQASGELAHSVVRA